MTPFIGSWSRTPSLCVSYCLEEMSVIFVLILISLSVAILFLGLFLWAVRSGQYDDDYSPSVRILFEELDESLVETKPNSCEDDKYQN